MSKRNYFAFSSPQPSPAGEGARTKEAHYGWAGLGCAEARSASKESHND